MHIHVTPSNVSSTCCISNSGSTCKRYEVHIHMCTPITWWYICATDTFMMTKLHKDIAMHMMQCVQSEEYTDSTTIKVTPLTACFEVHT